MGMCLPAECTQEDLDSFTDRMLGFVNAMILKLPEYGIVIDTLIFGPTSQVNMKFTQTDNYVADW